MILHHCSIMPNSRVNVIWTPSYEPGWASWLGFQDLTSLLFPMSKFRCVHVRRWAGPVTEIPVFLTRILVTGLGNISHMNTPAQLLGWIFFNYKCFTRSLTQLNAASDNMSSFLQENGKPVVQLFAWITSNGPWKPNSFPLPLGWTVHVLHLFHLGNQAEISHMNRRQNLPY